MRKLEKSYNSILTQYNQGFESLNILLYEHISGGGSVNVPLPSSLLCEGFAMLSGLTADFKNFGHNITIMLDYRVAKFKPLIKADRQIIVDSNPEKIFQDSLKDFEAAYVIAPESNRILQLIVKNVEDSGLLSLNCDSKIIAQTSSKGTLLEHVKGLGLNVPETLFFETIDLAELARTSSSALSFPIIVKPVDGAGCSGLSVVRDPQQLSMAISKIRKEDMLTPILAQKLVEGISTSVCLISNGDEAIPISLNRQFVNLASPDSLSGYIGGEVPFDSSLRDAAFLAAKQVVESFSGLRGYVGVDVILSDDKVFIIEVNPRLTTSYIGLRRVSNFNLSQAILDSILKHTLPKNISNLGYSYFSKVRMNSSSTMIYEEAKKIPELVSPPFPLYDDSDSYAMVESYGYTLKEAEAKFNKTRTELQQLTSRGK